MSNKQEALEEQHERLRQGELKNNPSRAFSDGLNRADHPNLADAAGKEQASIAVLIGGYVLYKLLF